MLKAGKQSASHRLKRLRNLEKYRARWELMSGNVKNLPKHQPVTLTVLPGHCKKKLKLGKKKKNKLYVA
jgi:hypothetical protein